MAYFVRFTENRDHAMCDLERGYSYVDYNFLPSREDVAEAYGLDVDDEDICPTPTGEWGLAMDGLCGFGPFETVEEAREDGQERQGYNGVNWPGFGIYRGSYVEDLRCWEGDCFRPIEIIEFVELA